MAACNIEVDICTLKQQRAKSRVRDIAVKRVEYQRARSVPRSRSSAPADRVKPHRIARTVTRSFVAKGVVQSEVDMPSITSMERSTSAHSRKKPSVAAMVSCGANPFVEESSIPLNACSDAEVVAFVGKNLKKPAVRIPGLALLTVNVACAAVCGPASGEGSVQEQVESLSVRRKVEEDEATEPSNEDCMAMVASDPGQDICAFKMRRAESRKRHIAAKRVDYQRARATPRARSSDPADRVKPHRIARTAARSFVAKGFVEGESDMPSLTSMGEPSSAHARKKPSVASLVQCGAAPCLEKSVVPIEDVSDLETTASEGEDVDKELPALRTAVASDSCSQELETPHSVEQDQEVEEEGELRQEGEEDGEVCRDECSLEGGEGKPSKGNETPTRREQVLRALVDQLRAQSKEERRRASEANAQKEDLEEQLRSVETKASKASEASKASKVQEKKVALQLEKRHAAEARKRRNQEQQLRHFKEKADSALQAAERMREQAEAEAIAAKARHLAEAEAMAQSEAEAFALVEAERVRHHTEELVQKRMDEVAQAKAALDASAAAEAEAIKAQAASEAEKAQALVEQMKAQAEDELRSMKVRAEVESRVIKARAEMEARATKAALEAERHAQLEVQAREQAQAEARAQAELAAQEEAAREAQRREEIAAQKEAAAARKRAKELEQQRAKQFRKQQQQERKREQLKEQELEAARAKAKEESDALRARALAEATALKANAEAEARAIRARAEGEALAKAEKEAQAKAEAEAEQAPAEAEQQADQLAQQEAECEPPCNEAEATSSTEPEAEERGWEVLPTADSHPSSGRGSSGSSKRWWNIFF